MNAYYWIEDEQNRYSKEYQKELLEVEQAEQEAKEEEQELPYYKLQK